MARFAYSGQGTRMLLVQEVATSVTQSTRVHVQERGTPNQALQLRSYEYFLTQLTSFFLT